MKIVSWNVNGIRAILQKGFKEAVENMAPDILCLQETKAQDDEVVKALGDLKTYTLKSNSAKRKGYSGSALLLKSMPITVTNDIGIGVHDDEGRVQCVEYEGFYLVNVYVPNSGQKLDRLEYRQQWDKDLLKYLKDLETKKPVVVCGDFNVAHQPIDLKNDKANYNKTAGYTQIEIDGMDAFLVSGFVDVYRMLHPDEVAYTYWSYRFKARERNVGWRIDYFLISRVLQDKVKSVEILSDIYGSDHCPIQLEIEL
ncbi:exodeoxyribonuclease III [Mangrovimonas sp. TPBH4]|uniref:exodeoxyribonuclease III n=1 Tax=Mangrovimonas sp. TPBH4 TaxID=1645914 RepID=UPI0006B53A0A|nr:exodeoxyribonuclease III [Mangrovimonas sp. TPBH4]